MIQEWLKENNLQIERRPYDHAIDAKDKTGKKTSFGDMASQIIAQELEKIMNKYRDKYTTEQYFDWLIKFMSEAKWNIIEK